MEIKEWADNNLSFIRAIHIKGQLNQKADWLSSHAIHNSEWNWEVNLILQKYSLPAVYLFSSPKDRKLLVAR